MSIRIAEYEAKLSWNAQDYQKGMNDAESTFNSFSEKMGTVGKGIATGLTAALPAASAAIVKIGKDAISAYADYEQLVGGVETLFKDSSDTVIKNAANAYKTAGMSANTYMETVTSFSASLLQSLGGDTKEAAKKADMAIVDMSDNANKMGSSIESIQNAYQGFAKQNYTMLDNLKLGYGGTKEEMARLLADAQAISGIEYDISSYSDIVDAIHIIQTEMGITGTTSKEASTTIQGSIASMKASWENLLAGLTDESQDFDTLINNLFNSIITVGDNLIPRISTVLSGVTQLVTQLAPKLIAVIPELLNQLLPPLVEGAVSLVNAVVAALPEIITCLMNALPTLIEGIQQLISGILEVLPEILTTIVDAAIAIIPILITAIIECLPQLLDCVLQMIQGLAQGILDAIPVIIAALPQIITSIVEFILSAIPQIIQTGIDLLTSLISALPTIIQTILTAIPQIIDGLINAILSNIPLIIQAGIDLLVSLIENLPTIIQTILTAIPQIISSLINAIANNIPLIIQAGVELLISLVKNLPQIIVAVVKAIPEIIKAIVSAVGTGVSQMADAGLNLIKGLFNGISNAVSWLYGKLKGWVSSVLDYIKGLFGIHSPSKETAEMGDFLVQGLAEGIEDNADKANEASKDLADNVLSNFEDMADDIAEIEDNAFNDSNTNKSVTLSTRYSDSGLTYKQEDSFTNGISNVFNNFIERAETMLDKWIDAFNVGSVNGVTTTSNKSITIKQGDITVSGVLDKDAAEQVKAIADEQIDDVVSAVAEFIPI